MLKLAVNKSIFWMLLTFSIKRSFAGETPVTLLITSFTWDPKGLYIRNKKWKLQSSHVRALLQQGFKNRVWAVVYPWITTQSFADSTVIYKKTTPPTEVLLTGKQPTDKDEQWSCSVSRSSNTSEYCETERDLSMLSHNSVANSKPYIRSFTRNQLDQ